MNAVIGVWMIAAAVSASDEGLYKAGVGLHEIDAIKTVKLTRPMLMITGSEDSNPLNPTLDVGWRLKAWESVPAGNKYLLWIEGAHHGFGGIAGKARYPGSGPKDSGQVECVRSTALAMWDAYLKDDAGAKAWLESGDVEKVKDVKAEICAR